MTSLYMSTEKGPQDMVTLATVADPAPKGREAKSPWDKSLTSDLAAKGGPGSSYLPLPSLHPPLPPHQSLPLLNLLICLNRLQRRDVNIGA